LGGRFPGHGWDAHTPPNITHPGTTSQIFIFSFVYCWQDSAVLHTPLEELRIQNSSAFSIHCSEVRYNEQGSITHPDFVMGLIMQPKITKINFYN
jgi:hypothetical protein